MHEHRQEQNIRIFPLHTGQTWFTWAHWFLRKKSRAIVTGTGMDTELGKIAGMLQEIPKESTPIQRKLGEFGKFCFLYSANLRCVYSISSDDIQNRNAGILRLDFRGYYIVISLVGYGAGQGLAGKNLSNPRMPEKISI